MDGSSLCGCCGGQRGFLYCAQHAARLCLLCDVTVHADAPTHQRAPLCAGCHAAPAAARCTQHQAALCAMCSAGCAAQRHHQRPARTFTGCPTNHDLATILTPDDDDDDDDDGTCCAWVVPDLVNIEQLPIVRTTCASNDNGNDKMSSELPSHDTFEGGSGGNLLNQQTAAGLFMADDGDDLLMQQDWPDLDDDLVDLAAQADSNPIIAPVEQAFEAASSLGYELSSCSETILPSDAVLQSLTSKNAAACQFSTVGTSSNVSFCTGDMPPVLQSDEFLFGAGLPPGPPPASTSMGYTDQEPPEKPGQDMEARMKQREKRQQAKQRYNDKKKNRRFGKQIMYESRKARADTRNRVKGRFAKSSSNSDQI